METIILWLILLVVISALITFWQTIIFARAIKHTSIGLIRGGYLNLHRFYSNLFSWLLVLIVVLIKWLVYVRKNMISDWVLWAHLGFVIPFVIIVILLKTKITGQKNRPLHKQLAYTAVGLFIFGFILGVYLIFR